MHNLNSLFELQNMSLQKSSTKAKRTNEVHCGSTIEQYKAKRTSHKIFHPIIQPKPLVFTYPLSQKFKFTHINPKAYNLKVNIHLITQFKLQKPRNPFSTFSPKCNSIHRMPHNRPLSYRTRETKNPPIKFKEQVTDWRKYFKDHMKDHQLPNQRN